MIIGFRWSIDNYEPHEKTFTTFEDCKNDIFDEYKDNKDVVIALVQDDDGLITVFWDAPAYQYEE